jgi:hypothetical protein
MKYQLRNQENQNEYEHERNKQTIHQDHFKVLFGGG